MAATSPPPSTGALLCQAGYDTKTSLITQFYTFAPENLAELLGQRRRWQVSKTTATQNSFPAALQKQEGRPGYMLAQVG